MATIHVNLRLPAIRKCLKCGTILEKEVRAAGFAIPAPQLKQDMYIDCCPECFYKDVTSAL